MTAARRLADLALRPLATTAALLRRRLRTDDGEPGSGAHAIALTPGRKVILVRLRYAPGWRLPGGGRSEDESLRDAALRELREEVGMVRYGAIRALAEIDPSLILVEDVGYAPRRWSWEVERVIEAAPDALPREMSPLARRWIAELKSLG